MPTTFAFQLFGGLLLLSAILSYFFSKKPFDRFIATCGLFALSSVSIVLLFGSFKIVRPTSWQTLYPNQKNITITVKSNDSDYQTVTENTPQKTINAINTIKLSQGKAINEKNIDITLIHGDGPLLDHLEYGTVYQQQTIFGKPVVKDVTATNTLKAFYKNTHSNETLNKLLK